MRTNETEDKTVTAEALAQMGPANTVYVTTVPSEELVGTVPGAEDLPTGTIFYAVHSGDGTRMAVLGDRDAAFAAARQYDMEPVSAH
jgi:hypothetical protein